MIRVGICGYGNLGRGVESAVNMNEDMELVGVGYKALVEGKNLILSLGFSHDVVFEAPEGIKITCAAPTQISIFGADKQLVGQVAAEIRKYRKP